MKLTKIFSLLIVLIMTGCNTNGANTKIKVVSRQEFHTLLSEDSDAYLLDVRKPEEFDAGHIKGAHLLNWLDTVAFKQGARNLDKSKTIYVYCRSGHRSGEAADYLAGKGYRVVDLDGGIMAWEESHLPIVTQSDADRQISPSFP